MEKESNMKDAPKQFIWTQEGIAKFQKELNKIENTRKMDNIMLISDENLTSIALNITDLLIKTAEKAKVKIATKKKSAVNNNPPWFDKTCSEIKNEIKSIGRKLKGDPNNATIRHKLYSTKRRLKTQVRKNKTNFQSSLFQKMNWNRNDSKLFWKLLDKLEKRPNDDIFKEVISGERWKAHFQSLSQPSSVDPKLPQNTTNIGSLDYEISFEEIKLGAYILRSGKAAGYDRISNEMLSCLLNTSPEIIKKLFNAILRNPKVLKLCGTSLSYHQFTKKDQKQNQKTIGVFLYYRALENSFHLF